jgi:DNA mismatch repair ATPase MutL
MSMGHQVHFLHEEDIVDSISQAIEKRLKGRRESVMEEEEKKEEAASSDEDARESEDEANRSVDSIEIDLSQKQAPPSKKYQPALVRAERGSRSARQRDAHGVGAVNVAGTAAPRTNGPSLEHDRQVLLPRVPAHSSVAALAVQLPRCGRSPRRQSRQDYEADRLRGQRLQRSKGLQPQEEEAV